MGYKEQKEAFVADGGGTSVAVINSVCLTALTTYTFWRALAKYIYPAAPQWKAAGAEFILLVLPLLLVLTILSSHPVLLNLCVSALVVIIFPRSRPDDRNASHPGSPVSQHLSPPGTPLRPSSPIGRPGTPNFGKRGLPPSPGRSDSPSHDVSIDGILTKSLERSRTRAPPAGAQGLRFSRPYITVYRAHMLVMTALCILAVDFPVFPRGFGKTETWGTSVMDIGVGSFVFSMGIVSASPLLRTVGVVPLLSSLRRAVVHSLPIIGLGVVRVLMVKGVDYPEHVSEYGVHWNFFITLAALPVLGVVAQRLYRHMPFSAMGLLATMAQQVLLSAAGLQSWCLEAPRTSWISANKEGLTSLLGYCAIYLLGVDTGIYALPPDPYFFKAPGDEKKLKTKSGKTATVFASWAMVWWLGYAFAVWVSPVSRRLANASYVLWIVATNVTLLLGYLLISELKIEGRSNAPAAPLTFEAINRNGLAFFLVANLLTGLVNTTVETMYASDSFAFLLLLLYSAATIAFAWYIRRIRLKI